MEIDVIVYPLSAKNKVPLGHLVVLNKLLKEGQLLEAFTAPG